MNINIIATLLLLVIDLLWVFFVMNGKYESMIRQIQKGQPMKVNYIYAILTYVLMIIGLNVLVIPNITKNNMWFPFLFGLIVYGVFSFTNASVLKDWKMSVVLLDTLWGGILFFTSVSLAKRLSN